MSNGNFADFLDALLAFESGWDRDRYDGGVIADWQLDSWAGGPVESYFPGYTNWGELTADEWETMAYRSTNSLGFVGFQFGEALLIDLGYYEDTQFYGNGASTNTWDGAWTGKNGVDSLNDFMTKAAQTVAIREAFGYNLQVIENGLAAAGQSLDDYLGTTVTYLDSGTEVSVELTLTGIMAASHLRGAWGTLALLQSGSVSADEYGTSILKYIEQFGGYEAPSVEDAIAYYEDRLTGDEGLGGPSHSTAPDADDSTSSDQSSMPPPVGTANVTEASADVLITWAWGTDAVVTDFDPATDTIFISWIGADLLSVSEVNGSVVFGVPSNNQTTTLLGVGLNELRATNFRILDGGAESKVLSLIGGSAAEDALTGPGGIKQPSDDHNDVAPQEPGHGAPDDGDAEEDSGMTGDGGSGHGHDHLHVTVTLTSGPQVIDGFRSTAGDVIDIGSGITASDFAIFEESGDALGQTVRLEITNGTTVTQTIFTGLGLSDLSLGNFSVDNQGVLNEVATALGSVVTMPGGPDPGYAPGSDTDGSNPPDVTGATAAGGVKYKADSNADDIVGFRPGTDQLDFGGTSVHGMIVTKSAQGDIVIDSPWSDTAQIVNGVTYQDVSIEDFGVVGNEHFRQDMGAVVSWEQGVGPRNADTIYLRSHEYGVHEVVDGFDPKSMKISFLYFGTRERLMVEDTDDGLVIWSLPTGQSMTFSGVQKSDLVPGLIEFHHDQVVEDNLETPFGFAADHVSLVDRTMLLTPAAPVGSTTDGAQTITGDLTGSVYAPTGDDPENAGVVPPTEDVTPSGLPVDNQLDPGAGLPSSAGEVLEFTWNWGVKDIVEDFDPGADEIDFNALGAANVSVTEEDADLIFEVLNNGGHTLTLKGVQAEDLSLANFTADDWNSILDPSSRFVSDLEGLGLGIA